MLQVQRLPLIAQSLNNFVINQAKPLLMTPFKISMIINFNKLMELLFMLCLERNIYLSFNFKLLMGLANLEALNSILVIFKKNLTLKCFAISSKVLVE